MRLTQFGTVTLPENNAEDSLPVSARSSLVPLANGSFDQDGSRLFLQTNRLSRRAEINADIDNVTNRLLKELGRGRGILRALWRDDETEVVTWAKLINFQRKADVEDYDCRSPITLTFEQDYPYWLNGADGWFFDTGETFDSGLYFDGTYYQFYTSSNSYDFTIPNTGSAAIPACTTVIVPRTGVTVTNPKIANLTNGMSFRYVGTLTAGQRLVVDWLTKTVEVDGVSVYGDFELGGDRQTQFMQLEVDDNDLRFTGTVSGGLVDMDFIFSRHYL